MPGIETFVSAFERAIKAGADAVISLHISKTLSNTVDVARLAAEKIKEIPVHVFDTGNLSLGVGLLARHAAQMAEAGEQVKTILAEISDKARRTLYPLHCWPHWNSCAAADASPTSSLDWAAF